VAAVDRIGSLSRRDCRATFDERFTVARMVSDYVAVYRSLIRAAETEVVAEIIPEEMPSA
jgi:hypothetical protein